MKKILMFLLSVIFFSSLVVAQSINIEFPNGNEFEAGEPITFKTTLYDSEGKPISGQIDITIEDSEKRVTKASVFSKEVSTINLEKEASSGQGIIKAKYEDAETIAFFEVGRKEIARFELNEKNLIVTNIGNTPYTRTIKISIGETTVTQNPNLNIGESASYRLLAPEGSYNVKVTDGKTSFIRNNVKLTGTGQAIGAVDDSASQRTGITGGVGPENSEIAILSYLKQNTFVYVFIAVVFGAMILIAIERRYGRRSRK